MDHLYRRNKILEILRAEKVGTQAELKQKLARRGIRVTQATLSRDLEELGVVKAHGGTEVAADDAHVCLRDVRLAGNLVIVKTNPGNAHSVAVSLDAETWPDVAGTVAGDDTIFIATTGAREAARIRKKILGLLRG